MTFKITVIFYEFSPTQLCNYRKIMLIIPAPSPEHSRAHEHNRRTDDFSTSGNLVSNNDYVQLVRTCVDVSNNEDVG